MSDAREPLRSVIAIDGGAATGKTTTAAAVASRLGFCYVDSGAIYRALAMALRRRGFRTPEGGAEAVLTPLLEQLDVTVEPTAEKFIVRLDGVPVGAEIRSPEITHLASELATRAEVRGLVRELVRSAAQQGSLVVEGRDIGTVVFPDARLKIFLSADLTVRAERRQIDLEKQGRHVDRGAVAADLAERDERDSTRVESPLKRAPDAVEVDTTALSIDEQVDAIVAIYRARTASDAAPGAGAKRTSEHHGADYRGDDHEAHGEDGSR